MSLPPDCAPHPPHPPHSLVLHTLPCTCIHECLWEFSHGRQRERQRERITHRSCWFSGWSVMYNGIRVEKDPFCFVTWLTVSLLRAPSQGTSSWFWFWGPPPSCSARCPTSSSSSTRMSSRWRCRCVVTHEEERECCTLLSPMRQIVICEYGLYKYHLYWLIEHVEMLRKYNTKLVFKNSDNSHCTINGS